MSVVGWLDERARQLIEREAVKRRLCETGGALFGWQTDDDIVVACASGPGTRAKPRPTRFEPDPTTTARAIKLANVESKGRYRFLGSWHTHPRGRAKPSSLDKTTARELADQDDLALPQPLLVILGTTGTKRHVRTGELRAWSWSLEERALQDVEVRGCRLTERYCPTQALFV